MSKKQSSEKIDKKIINNVKINDNIIKNDDDDEKSITVKTVVSQIPPAIKSSNIHIPFVNTTLVCPVMLYPNQMENKLYLNLKTNLINKLVGKCYKNYGLVVKIYKIDEYSDGVIEAEDPTCSAKFVVKFSCRLCIPIKNKEIICRINRMNKELIGGVNGPISIIIPPDKINSHKFFTDTNRNVRVRGGNSDILVPNIYIRVLILTVTFSDYDTQILTIGYLIDIATQDEINNSIQTDRMNTFTDDDENNNIDENN